MKSFTFLSLLVISYSTFSQSEYLVTLEGDTISGRIGFERDNFYDLATIKTAEGRSTYKPYQLKSITKDGFLFIPLDYNNRKVFGKVIHRGTIDRYNLLFEDTGDFRTDVLIKPDRSTLVISTIKLKKRLLKFLSDCEYVTSRISEKKLSTSNLDKVLSEYEQYCGNGEMATESSDKKNRPVLIEFAQLIIDIQKKLDSNERVPVYMIDALKKYNPSDLDSAIERLIDEIGK